MKSKSYIRILMLLALVELSINFSYAQAPLNWTSDLTTYYFPLGNPPCPACTRPMCAVYTPAGNVLAAGNLKHGSNSNQYAYIKSWNDAGTQSVNYSSAYDPSPIENHNGDYASKVVSTGSGNVFALMRIGLDSIGVNVPSYNLAKFDNNLVQQWRVPTFKDIGNGLIDADAWGNVLFAGVTVNPGSVSGIKIVVIKYNGSTGAILWRTDLKDNGQGNIVALASLKVDLAGNALVCGTVNSSTFGNRYFTTKINSDSTVAWKRYRDAENSAANDSAMTMVIDHAQNIIVSGCGVVNSVKYIYTTKYSQTGTMLWNRKRHIDGNAGAEYVQTDNADNIYVAGHCIQSGNPNFAIIKYDANGNLLWIAKPGQFNVNAFCTSESGASYIGGNKHYYGSYLQANTAYLRKIDSNGNVEWSYSDTDVPNSDSTVAVGYNSNYDFVIANSGLQSVAAVGTSYRDRKIWWDGTHEYYCSWKIDHFNPSVRIEMSNSKNLITDLQLYPNPANNQLQLIFNNDFENAELTVLDLQGREVMNKKLNENEEVVDVSKLTVGIYVARIIYDGHVVNKKFVKE